MRALGICFRFLPKEREGNIQGTDLGSSSLKLQPCSTDFEANSRGGGNKMEWKEWRDFIVLAPVHRVAQANDSL